MARKFITKRRLLTLTAAVLVVGAATIAMQYREATTRPAGGAGAEVVVLVYGLARTSASMSILAGRLRDEGYRVENWGYGSFGNTIDGHATTLNAFIDQIESDDGVTHIHCVGHSLGNIVIRAALIADPPTKPGRIVMLAPPNQGSADAAFWTPLLGDVVQPLRELSNESNSIVKQMGVPTGIEIGIIAAADDGRVNLADTHIDGEKDHLIVPGMHTFIILRDDVAHQVAYFFKHGQFERSH